MTLHLPSNIELEEKKVQYVALNNDTDVHRLIRNDLESEGLLNSELFIEKFNCGFLTSFKSEKTFLNQC